MKKPIFLAVIAMFACHVFADEPASKANALITPVINTFMRVRDVPGVAIAYYDHGQMSFYQFGVANKETRQPITKDTIFEIGSNTKLFTAALLAEQVQAGHMKLEDKVVKYLPPVMSKEGSSIKQVTLLELATHTSGLPADPPGMRMKNSTKNELFNYVMHWQANGAIGTWKYSNIGFGLIGYALVDVTKQPYERLLSENIFKPLDMQSSSLNFAVHPQNYAQGYGKMGRPVARWPENAWPAGGAVRSTSVDMSNFMRASLNVAGPEKLRQAIQLTQKGFVQEKNFTQGLAWTIEKNGLVWKAGGTAGFTSAVVLDPKNERGIVILTNKNGDQATRIAMRLLLMIRNRS